MEVDSIGWFDGIDVGLEGGRRRSGTSLGKTSQAFAANAGLRVRKRGRESRMKEWEVGVGVKVGVCLRWI